MTTPGPHAKASCNPHCEEVCGVGWGLMREHKPTPHPCQAHDSMHLHHQRCDDPVSTCHPMCQSTFLPDLTLHPVCEVLMATYDGIFLKGLSREW